MRILLIADIHANWAALQALPEPWDVCLCLGDLVDYGVEPAPVVNWVREHATHAVRGNHDHGAAQNVVVQGRNGFKQLTGLTRPITRQRLSEEDLRWLGRLPVSRAVTLDGLRFLLVHATPRDPLDEYGPADPEFWARRLDGVDADVVCVGHTHQQYVLRLGTKMIINPGSLGQPRDGDPRGCYAIMENRQVTLKRFEYPVEDMVRSIEESSLPDHAKESLAAVYRSGRGPLANARARVAAQQAAGETPPNANGTPVEGAVTT